MVGMKKRFLSALAVLAAVTALSACDGRRVHSSGAGTAPAGAVATSPRPSAGSVGGSSTAGVTGGTTDGSDTSLPDADLSTIDQQLSGVDGALSSAAQS